MIRQNFAAFSIIGLVSAAALAFLFWLIYFMNPVEIQSTNFVSALPYVNASLNACSAICLFLGVRFIKKGHKEAHIKLMITSLIFSTFFLISYITYHTLHGDTKFLATGAIRPIYFFILISHIILSIGALPMVLGTFYLGWKKKWDSHKKLAKWTYPIWLYVSVTGVLVVAILKTFQPS